KVDKCCAAGRCDTRTRHGCRSAHGARVRRRFLPFSIDGLNELAGLGQAVRIKGEKDVNSPRSTKRRASVTFVCLIARCSRTAAGRPSGCQVAAMSPIAVGNLLLVCDLGKFTCHCGNNVRQRIQLSAHQTIESQSLNVSSTTAL